MTEPAPEVQVYWRPGCGFCASLRRQLERADVPYHAINIWEDESAAATVRSVAGGNETVPTVIVGSHAMVNPSLKAVLKAIRAESPGEEPDNAAGDQPGGLSSLLGKLRGKDR